VFFNISKKLNNYLKKRLERTAKEMGDLTYKVASADDNKKIAFV
jgi:hypothetical protein